MRAEPKNKMSLYWWLRRLLGLIVKSRVTPDPVRASLDLAGDKPICYCLRVRSLADLLTLYTSCEKAGLPLPLAIPSHLREGQQASYICLTQPGILQPRRGIDHQAPSPIADLVQATTNNKSLDIQLVPVSIIWGRNPGKDESSLLKLLFFDQEHAGIVQKLFIVLAQGRNSVVHFGKPISLRQVVDEGLAPEQTAKKVRRVLRVHFREQRNALLGPAIYDRVAAIESIIRSKPVRLAIEEEARKTNTTVTKVTVKARHYADEIAADVTFPVIRFFDIFLSWLWNKLFDGVTVRNPEALLPLAEGKEVIFAPCHRSHLDYMLLSYAAYYAGIMPPHTAAGINLNFWPAGPLLRRGGAFFMRRSFRGNRLYTSVFNEYFHFLLTRGHSVTFFAEGGRSRTGRLLQPKTGMITMVLQSFARNSDKPIVLLPTFIGYDKIIEVKTYLRELRGNNKKKESIGQLFKVRNALKASHGKAYLNFGEPIYLNDYLDKYFPVWRQDKGDETKEARPTWMSDAAHAIAVEIMTRINQAVCVGPVQLFALTLLSSPQKAMTEEDLLHATAILVDYLNACPYSHNVWMQPLALADALRQAERISPITRFQHPGGDVIYLEDGESAQMHYYRNNILHLFALPSMIAAYFLYNDEVSESAVINGCQELYPLLREELFLPWDESEVKNVLGKIIKALCGQNLLVKSTDGQTLHRTPVTNRDFANLTIVGRILGKTIERYAIVTALLHQNYGHNWISRDEFEKQCQLTAQRISILSGVNDPEFFDKGLFAHLIDALKRYDYLETEGENRLRVKARITELATNTLALLSHDVRQSIARYSTESKPLPNVSPTADAKFEMTSESKAHG